MISGKRRMNRQSHIMDGMKIAFFVLAAGLYLLPACGAADQNNITDASETAEPDMVDSDFEYRMTAQSDKGYYLWERIHKDQLQPHLVFMDRETRRVVPLCNKPDCVHEGKDCNAYYSYVDSAEGGVDRRYLQYYEGNLYAVGLSADDYVVLYRIKEDGSEWDVCTKLYKTDYSSTSHWISPEVLIKDGYVYFIDAKQEKMKLERVPIDGGTQPETVFEEVSEALYVDVHRMKSKDQYIYFQSVAFTDENFDYSLGALYRYDTISGQCDVVRESLYGPYSVKEDFVYYANTDGLCRYSMENGTIEIINDHPMSVPNITLTKDYIVLCDQMVDHSLYIYDYEGNELLAVPNTVGLLQCFGGNSELMFGECAVDGGLGLCFLDLTRPLDELEWEELKAD